MIGVIADDLSGAAEIGGIAWRHGLKTDLRLSRGAAANADVVCLSTDSRDVSRDEAVERSAAAADYLLRSGVTWIYKKVDSVLRGHLVPEVKVILEKQKGRHALIVPANPSKGRCIINGCYQIDGRPLNETDFHDDPEHPRLSSNVAELLGNDRGVAVERCRDASTQELQTVVVGEATSADDLRCWVAKRSAFDLVGGAAEFFQALLEAIGHKAMPCVEGGNPFAESGSALFVCGSVSDGTLRFVAEARQAGVKVMTAPETVTGENAPVPAAGSQGVDEAVDVLGPSGSLVLIASDQRINDVDRSRELFDRLIHTACQILRRTNVSHVFVEGGTTAAALLHVMGWSHARIADEPSPGVVTLSVGSTCHQLLTLKPGSYNWPESVRRRVLREKCHVD